MGVKSAAALLLVLAGAAHAETDWARGMVTADGVGVADRHAPSPAVARGTARRGAEDAARATITAQLAAIPLAAGGTLGDRLREPAIKARVDRAVAEAIAVAADPQTDGAWKVTMGVPLEALRQALDGPRALTASDAEPAVVIVELPDRATPALGWQIGGKPVATLWVKTVPGWAKDAPHAKASAAKNGSLELAAPVGGPATLYLVVTK